MNKVRSQVTGIKKRTVISLKMKIALIKLCVEHNPFENDYNDSWIAITENLNAHYSMDFDRKTLVKIVKRYLLEYKSDKLKFKTGTEEDETEMKSLLEILHGYQEAALAQQTVTVGQKEDEENLENEDLSSVPMTPAAIKKERSTANDEREKIVSNGKRKRAFELDEDELIRRKQENDHEIELKRIRLEERRLEIEAEKLKMSAEESRRRDDFQNSQMEFQKSLLTVMEAFLKK